jgi:hypothetical protein
MYSRLYLLGKWGSEDTEQLNEYEGPEGPC